jgi:hypothetical protein
VSTIDSPGSGGPNSNGRAAIAGLEGALGGLKNFGPFFFSQVQTWQKADETRHGLGGGEPIFFSRHTNEFVGNEKVAAEPAGADRFAKRCRRVYEGGVAGPTLGSSENSRRATAVRVAAAGTAVRQYGGTRP